MLKGLAIGLAVAAVMLTANIAAAPLRTDSVLAEGKFYRCLAYYAAADKSVVSGWTQVKTGWDAGQWLPVDREWVAGLAWPCGLDNAGGGVYNAAQEDKQ